MNQSIVIRRDERTVHSFEIPYQVKVFYTLSNTSNSIMIRCGLNVFETVDNSIITDEFLKNMRDLITSNLNSTIEYRVGERVVGSLLVDSNTYIAYQTRLDENKVLVEDLEISNLV